MVCLVYTGLVLAFIGATYTLKTSLDFGKLQRNQRKNVLFIVADDMRPSIGVYQDEDMPRSDPVIFTPNLDDLAKRSLLLKRAYVQQAVCSPSRTSFLTGRRPMTTHVFDLYHYFRNVGGDFVTLPQYFKQNGYESVGVGKIYHPSKEASGSNQDSPHSWNVMDQANGKAFHALPRNPSYGHFNQTMLKGRIPEDENILHVAKSHLYRLSKNYKEKEKNFFLAVGFRKPHLPFVVPEKYLNMYPASNVSIAKFRYPPVGMPKIAWWNYMELRNYPNMANYTGAYGTELSLFHQIELRRHYYAAISWIDSLIGSLLTELDQLGLRESTIVSFIGDHGWQLGEHGIWCKMTNFELATHAPMMISIPGRTDNGVKVNLPTEFVDLYPTLVEAAGFEPMPLCPELAGKVALCREGESLLPLIDDPNLQTWKSRAFSLYHRNHQSVMGFTVRTLRYRYTEWVKWNADHEKGIYEPVWSDIKGKELYDHKYDPEENVNQMYNLLYSNVIPELSAQLRAGWRAAIGPNYDRNKVDEIPTDLKTFNVKSEVKPLPKRNQKPIMDLNVSNNLQSILGNMGALDTKQYGAPVSSSNYGDLTNNNYNDIFGIPSQNEAASLWNVGKSRTNRDPPPESVVSNSNDKTASSQKDNNILNSYRKNFNLKSFFQRGKLEGQTRKDSRSLEDYIM